MIESYIFQQHCVSYRDCTMPKKTNYVKSWKKVFLAYVMVLPHSHRKTIHKYLIEDSLSIGPITKIQSYNTTTTPTCSAGNCIMSFLLKLFSNQCQQRGWGKSVQITGAQQSGKGPEAQIYCVWFCLCQ